MKRLFRKPVTKYLLSLLALISAMGFMPDVTRELHSPVLPAASDSEIFSDVTRAAGINAVHRGHWDMFNPEFESGYLGIGQAWGDYDGDGWLDLYVTGNMEPNVLYRNNGDGTFSVSPYSEALSLPDILSGGAVWADYDNDGWKDLYVLSHGANVLFHNEGGKGFTDVTAAAGVGDTGKGSTATWGDYDNDSYLDLYVASWACYPECRPLDNTRAQDRLYHNNGDGTFSDVSDTLIYEKLLGAGFTASFVDFDNDGDSDLYVVNDALKNPIGNVLWRNDGPGCGHWCWADISEEAGADIEVDGMGLAVGDFDKDLDLDFYFSNMVNPMALLQNNGDGTFADIADNAGVAVGPSEAVGWGTSFFDFDNDSWLDLYLTTTGFVQYTIETGPETMHASHRDYLFRNNGDGTFSDASPPSWVEKIHPSMGLAYADYDQDGWVDLVIGHWNEGYSLYHNEGIAGQGNHWLTVRLAGGGPINQDAIGTRVYVTGSDGWVQLQEIKNGSSLGAGNDTALHFGLGQTTVDKVIVQWPNGDIHHFSNVPTDGTWQMSYTHAVRRLQWMWAGIIGLGLLVMGGLGWWLVRRRALASG